MGGGYGPRLITLEQHLAGTLPADVDVRALHLRDDYRDPINDSMAALDELLRKAAPDPLTAPAA